ncbi:MAG: CPBP family intramembrane glutamic endopeptidase [Acidobacteriaceae bacterium]
MPIKLLYSIRADGAFAAALRPGPFATGIAGGMLAGLSIGTLGYILLARKSVAVSGYIQKQLAAVSMFLPETKTERRWFVLVSLTAGICEEFLYRGFLIHYLHSLSLHLELWMALLLSSVIFGLAHVYQGVKGILQTALLGFFFGLIFLMSGTLLLPILLHVLIDLRILLLLPRTKDVLPALSPELP